MADRRFPDLDEVRGWGPICGMSAEEAWHFAREYEARTEPDAETRRILDVVDACFRPCCCRTLMGLRLRTNPRCPRHGGSTRP